MDARIEASEKTVTVRMGLLRNQATQVVLQEQTSSGPFTFRIIDEGPDKIGLWSGKTGPESVTIGYRADIVIRPPGARSANTPALGSPPAVSPEISRLAGHLAGKWALLPPPARLQAVEATGRDRWGTPEPERADLEKWSSFQETHGMPAAFLLLLHAADLPAREVSGLSLTNGATAEPIQWIEVWTGRQWERMDPLTGIIYDSSSFFLPLTTGTVYPLRIAGSRFSESRWILTQRVVTQWQTRFEEIRKSDCFLDRFSLFSLPNEFQNTFRIFLLVPIAALIICVLRNIIGFPTFGVFMPVLMALAFINTGLIWGLGIFSGIVLSGFFVRRWIDRLRLLLVPRLSVILTFVVICFTVIALIGSKIGIRQFMSVGLLPFVILTMTIERFFVIVEESGAVEGFKTAAGSAAVAAIAYEIIHSESLQLTFFIYPELLFAVAAVQLLIGRYTGYRLIEFIRFREFRRYP